MRYLPTFLALLGLTLPLRASLASIDEAWEPISNPEIMSYFFIRQFDQLPLQGKVTPSGKYWSGGYWALRNGNINYRWNAKRKIGFRLNSPNREAAKGMSIVELAELAPTEKYDLFTGHYDYPLRNEVALIADPGAESWEGICHGWSPATMNHEEPSPKLMRNPDGIDIPFGSSDIKALLSYYYAYGPITPTYQMGRRCYHGRFFNRDHDCQEDLNAGAFHIVLTNRLGLKGVGFVADLQRYEQVWNYPVEKYTASITGTFKPDGQSSPGTTTVYRLHTVITYVDESPENWQKIKGTRNQREKSMAFDYLVETDAFQNILGGKWLSRDRPDFLWMKDRPDHFSGSLSRLAELIDD